MQNLEGRVAVVTGASSGIGLGIAKALAGHGVKIVMASQSADRLSAAAEEVRALGADVLEVPTDVAQKAEIERLAEKTLERFGAVHILVNNAGVYAPGYAWELDDDDWDWVVDVNYWGTVNGIRVFMPHLLEQDEAHVVNVSSAGGLMTAMCHGPYTSTKHAIVGLSKGLKVEVAMKQSNVGVTLVCPGGVATNISSQFDRSGPDGQPRGERPLPDEVKELWKAVDATVDGGISSDEVGQMVNQAITENVFWVLPNAECYFPIFDQEFADMKNAIRN